MTVPAILELVRMATAMILVAAAVVGVLRRRWLAAAVCLSWAVFVVVWMLGIDVPVLVRAVLLYIPMVVVAVRLSTEA